MKVKILAMSPPPAAFRTERTVLMCAGCGSGFEAERRRGVYVKALRAKDGGQVYLPFCAICSSVIDGLELLVTTNLHSTNALRQAVKEAVALRAGYVTEME